MTTTSEGQSTSSKHRQVFLKEARRVVNEHLHLNKTQPEGIERELTFALATLFVQGSDVLPPLALRFYPHEDDREFLIEEGQNYHPEAQDADDLATPELLSLLKAETITYPAEKATEGQEPRVYNSTEQITLLGVHLLGNADYWSSLKERPESRLSGVLHSILAMLDGSSFGLPGMLVSSKEEFAQNKLSDMEGHLHDEMYRGWTPQARVANNTSKNNR